MKKENIKIISDFDGLSLDTLIYIPEKIKGIVLIAHGMAEHKERYISFMEFLAENGYVACINDHRGHGLSVKDKKDLGYFYDESSKGIVDDTRQICLYLKDRFNDVPFILFGHSMGSFIVRCFARKYDKDIDKLIVCGSPSENPACGIALLLIDIIKLFKGDRYISNLMVNLSTGAYDKAYPQEGHNSWLSTDKENVKKYNSDELCGFAFTLNGYKSLMNLMKNAYAKDGWAMNNKNMPIMFISGKGDPCAESEKKWHSAISNMISHGYDNVSGMMYENSRHEILLDVDKDEVYKDVLNFIGE